MSVLTDLQSILPSDCPFIQYHEPMHKHTTMRVGGAATAYITPPTVQEFLQIHPLLLSHAIPFVAFGKGSNVLVPDTGYDGVILCTSALQAIHVEGTTITAEAGIPLKRLAKSAYGAGLTGLEFAEGIPGTLGGAVFMNAGAYDGQMAQCVASVQYLDETGTVQTMDAPALHFGYRHSIFKEHPKWVLLSVTMHLQKGNPTAIRAKMEEYANRRQSKQPLDLPSAGSVFKRPMGDFAGRLIQAAGMKGARVGDAQVSEKHAGFIVNLGQATCQDIITLIHQVQEQVYQTSGVHLECEVRLLGQEGVL